MRIIKSMEDKYWILSLELVESVFTASESAEDGALVRRLVEEIRCKRFYLPGLELIMVNEADEIIGYVNFARSHLIWKIRRGAAALFSGGGKNGTPAAAHFQGADRIRPSAGKGTGLQGCHRGGQSYELLQPWLRHFRRLWHHCT